MWMSRASAGRPSPTPPRTRPLARARRSTAAGRLPGDALDAGAERLDQRPQRGHLLRDRGVVPLDGDQPRHRHARDRLALAALPVPHHAAGLGEFVRRVVHQRRGDARRCACPGGWRPAGRTRAAMVANDVEVGAGLPRRGDRRVERVHERVHVGGGDVVLLIPCRRGQHDVGVGAGAGHPEVDGGDQVQLGPRRRPRASAPRPGAAALGDSSARTASSTPSRCRMKYSMPLPEEPSRLARQTVITRGKFAGSSGSSPANCSRPAFSSADHVVADALAGLGRVVGQVERVAVEGGVRGRPAHPRGLGERVGERPAGEQAAARAGWPARRRRSSRSATGRCAGRRTTCRSCAGSAAASPARTRPAGTRSAAAPSPGRRSAPSRRRSRPGSRTAW